MKFFANLIPGNMHAEIAILSPGSSREAMKMAYHHHRDRVRGSLSAFPFPRRYKELLERCA